MSTTTTQPKPKRRFQSEAQILKRIDQVRALMRRQDDARMSLLAEMKRAQEASAKEDNLTDVAVKFMVLEDRLRLNESAHKKAGRRLERLSDRLATMRTPVLVAVAGEDGSILR